jgi:hypothetical protein
MAVIKTKVMPKPAVIVFIFFSFGTASRLSG